MPSKIFVKGARENNLKNIDVEIPRDALTVITGLSGSGKSSLAFDTIYAEGQRRYVESLSSYARMFLGQKEKPDVDYIEGLSPAISIDQKTTSQNPRSTVGTVTEVYDYLRLLWARVGTPHCPNCGKEIRQQSIDQIIDQLMALGEGTRVQIMAPVIRGKKGEHVKIFEDARRSGYVRVRADGNMYDLSEEISLEKNKKHNIEVVVDRLILRPDVVHRLTDSCETAAALSGGLILANILPDDRDILFSQNYACEDCGISIEELTPRMFSFNNPFGACPTCTGLGTQLKVDPELVIPNKSVSLLDGAICASGWNNVRGDGISRMYFEALSKKYHFSLRDPVEKLSKEVMDVILYGTKGEKLELQYDQPRGKGVLYQAFEGIIPNLERRYKETQSDGVREELESCMSECPCPTCGGKRLRRESLAVTVGGLSISDYCEKSVVDALDFVDKLTLTEQQMRIGERILKEIKNRLGFLRSVGLEYLTLSRASATLSGGEAQRIRLATQIGALLGNTANLVSEQGNPQMASALTSMSGALGNVGDQLGNLEDILDKLGFNTGNISSGNASIQAGLDSLSDAAQDLGKAADDFDKSLDILKTDSALTSATLGHMSASLGIMAEGMSGLTSMTSQAADIVHWLAEQDPIHVPRPSSEMTATKDELFDAVTNMTDQMSTLNRDMLSASNTLTSNLRSINDQINVVSNLLLDAVEEISDPGSKNIFEDESENLTAQNEGKIEDLRLQRSVLLIRSEHQKNIFCSRKLLRRVVDI